MTREEEISRQIDIEMEKALLQQPFKQQAGNFRLSPRRIQATKPPPSHHLFGDKNNSSVPASPTSRTRSEQLEIPESPRRTRDSWWQAASIADFKSLDGFGSGLESPRDISRSRRETRQARALQTQSITDIGYESSSFLSPSPKTRNELRYCTPRATFGYARVPQRNGNEVSYQTREENRYHREPMTERSDRDSLRMKDKDFVRAAGRATCHSRRYDTPAGEEALMGRARSQTPDFHRRYAHNIIGTSLPGCSPRMGDQTSAPEQPSHRPLRRMASAQGGATRDRPIEVRRPVRAAASKQAFSIRSSGDAENGRCRRLQPSLSAQEIGASAMYKGLAAGAAGGGRPLWC